MKSNVIHVDFSKVTKENNSIVFKIKRIFKKLFGLNRKSPTPANVIVYRKNIS